jgi:hypothetical protein
MTWIIDYTSSSARSIFALIVICLVVCCIQEAPTAYGSASPFTADEDMIQSLSPDYYEQEEEQTTRTAATFSVNMTAAPPPNLVFVITDEQNFRTVSCYRDYLLKRYNMSQVDVWGDNINVHTPNIDSLATDGAMFTNFYTSSPLCTPSRGTFMTGMYPQFIGTEFNKGELNTTIMTWADILRKRKGYVTSYMGKWHLDGDVEPVSNSRNLINPSCFSHVLSHRMTMISKGNWCAKWT